VTIEPRRIVRLCGALLSMMLLAACAGGGARHAAPTSTRSSTAAPAAEPRAERGNPPFYDVLGKRYHVLPTSAGYRARGVASWYGPDFHGLATSSGERYDMNAMTAAHTTLPLPTWVEVTNLENGRSVVVKVNDRGPFVDNRLIDLSYAAARALDMVRNGTARVEVRTMASPPGQPLLATAPATPPPTPARAAAAVETVPPRPVIVPTAPNAPPPLEASVFSLPSALVAATAADSRMFVQAGAFAQRDNAVRLVARLKADGFADTFIVSDRTGGRMLHRVRFGPIRDAEEFDRIKPRLRAAGVIDPQLVVER
jgi:peptidoglycan lytic transglycosylase